MALLFLATFASEDLACISAGLLVAQRRLTFFEGVLSCFLGIFAGDLLAFLLGRGGIEAGWISGPKILTAREWIGPRGAAAVFISRFTPGLRVATYFTAGVLKMPAWQFVGSLVPATALWVPLIVSATMFFGSRVVEYYLHNLTIAVAALALGFVSLYLFRSIRRAG